VLVEERDFVAIGYRNFTIASLALEAMDYYEPTAFFDYRVAAVLAFKREFHLP
jgi:hypothetical protein